MKLYRTEVSDFLKANHPRPLSANRIAVRTGLSITTVRRTLNILRDARLAERNLDMGLNGGTLYTWYWCGGDFDPMARPHRVIAKAAEGVGE